MGARKARCKMKIKVIATRSNELRDSCWRLLQLDDGTLHVEQEAEYRNGERKKRIVPINDFMRESGPPPRWLPKLVDRMFDDP
jgi:hypothetical protein